MLEDDLTAVAERVAPPARPDLVEAVLARLDAPRPSRRRRTVAVAVVAALVAAFGLSPTVRAAAADLLELMGIELSDEAPESSRTPEQPLPGDHATDLDGAAVEAMFPLSAPTDLGEPEQVRVSDEGRVVSMRWRDGRVVLDQFDGTIGPVFEKQVGEIDVREVDLGGVPGWWVPEPHDLLYVDREGEIVQSTARLAGRTLFWESSEGVTLRLEGEDLGRREAVALARSVEPLPGTD